MTISYFFALPLELLIGSIAGFYFSDQHKRLTMTELLMALIGQILLNVFIIWRYPDMDFETWFHLGLFLAAVTMGAILGRFIRWSLVKKLSKSSVKKRQVQVAMSDFVKSAKYSAYDPNPQSCSTLHTKLQDAVTEIHRLKDLTIMIKEYNLLNRLNLIEESCYSIMRLSRCVTEQPIDNFDSDHYVKLCYQLTDLTWHTMNQLEGVTHRELHHRAAWTILMLVKTQISR